MKLLELENNFTLQNLQSLFDADNEIKALRVKNYMDPQICKKLSKRLFENQQQVFSHYIFAKELDILKTGINFGEACADHGLFSKYFAQVEGLNFMLRQIAYPYLSPIDKLRLDLDNIWPHGTVIPKINGKKMLTGLYRNIAVGASLPNHQDSIVNEYPDIDFKVKVELGSNVFLATPPHGSGGEFVVFNYSPDYNKTYGKLYNKNAKKSHSYIESRHENELKNKKFISIAPNVGDLILFRAESIHTVNKVTSGKRLSSTFHCAYSGDDEPLRCWI